MSIIVTKYIPDGGGMGDYGQVVAIFGGSYSIEYVRTELDRRGCFTKNDSRHTSMWNPYFEVTESKITVDHLGDVV